MGAGVVVLVIGGVTGGGDISWRFCFWGGSVLVLDLDLDSDLGQGTNWV